MYFVYLLKSLKDSKYYIGQTDDVEKRIKQHNSGLVQSTKSRKPFVLVGFQTYKSRNEARWLEYNLKNHSDKKKKFIKQFEIKEPPVLGSPTRRTSGPEGR